MRPHNPFAPPSADLNELPAKDEGIRKPRSVWLVQFFGAIFALSNAAGMALFIYRVISYQALSQTDVRNWLQTAWQLFLVLAMLLMLLQLPKRSRLGRNLGLGMIALFAVGATFSDHGPASSNVYYTVGQWLGTGLVLALLAYFAFAFAFSEKARRYFSTAQHA